MGLRSWLLAGTLLSPILGLLLAWVLTATIRRWAARVDAARRRAEALLGHLPTGLVALDAQGLIVASNATAEELWGAPLPRGLSWAHLLRGHPWLDLEGVRLTPEEMPLLAALAQGRTVVGMGLISRPGGQPLTVVARAVPLPGLDGRGGALCTFEPVTAAAQPARPDAAAPSEPRPRLTPAQAVPLLEEIWDALPDPALVLVQDDRVTSGARVIGVNEAARRLLGLPTQGDALCPVAELLPRLQVRGSNGEPLEPERWLPVQVLAGGAQREESLLIRPLAGCELSLAARVTPFTSTVTGLRYAIWLPRLTGSTVGANAASASPAGLHSPAGAPPRDRPASM